MIQCNFCNEEALGVYAHGGAPVSFAVCDEHVFLLGCSPDTIKRARHWYKRGDSYTEKDHEERKEMERGDWNRKRREFDDKARELNPQPTIHL